VVSLGKYQPTSADSPLLGPVVAGPEGELAEAGDEGRDRWSPDRYLAVFLTRIEVYLPGKNGIIEQ
jgi:hypothetical protein